MTTIHIQHGRVIDPANNIDRVGDVYIVDGKIAALFVAPEGFHADTVIDATGKVVCAGFIDISTRLRDMGHSRKATFKSETRAAASAGVTTMCLQPDTRPVMDAASIAEYVKDLAEKAGYPQIYPIGALTQKLEGAELSSMLALKQA
ncbi:MAG: dihydroorotase, partial [Methylococcales bacterium]|nr:dihydroorotase [Methylococcales bacterium]